MGEGTPAVLLGYFLVRGVLTLKGFSMYCMMAKNFALATETLKKALDAHHVVVPHSKCIGQRLRKLQSVRQCLLR